MKQPNLIDILSETEGKFIQVSHVYNDHAPGFNDHVPGLSKLWPYQNGVQQIEHPTSETWIFE